MQKFHVGKNGVAPCNATVNRCRYQTDDSTDSHFSATNIEAARKFYENIMEDSEDSATVSRKNGKVEFVKATQEEIDRKIDHKILSETLESVSADIYDVKKALKGKLTAGQHLKKLRFLLELKSEFLKVSGSLAKLSNDPDAAADFNEEKETLVKEIDDLKRQFSFLNNQRIERNEKAAAMKLVREKEMTAKFKKRNEEMKKEIDRVDAINKVNYVKSEVPSTFEKDKSKIEINEEHVSDNVSMWSIRSRDARFLNVSTPFPYGYVVVRLKTTEKDEETAGEKLKNFFTDQKKKEERRQKNLSAGDKVVIFSKTAKTPEVFKISPEFSQLVQQKMEIEADPVKLDDWSKSVSTIHQVYRNFPADKIPLGNEEVHVLKERILEKRHAALREIEDQKARETEAVEYGNQFAVEIDTDRENEDSQARLAGGERLVSLLGASDFSN